MLVLPVVSGGQALLLHGRFSLLNFDEWRWPESFFFLRHDKVGLCYYCIFHGVLVHLMELVVPSIDGVVVDSLSVLCKHYHFNVLRFDIFKFFSSKVMYDLFFIYNDLFKDGFIFCVR